MLFLLLTIPLRCAIIRTYQTEQRQIANVWFGAIRKRVARVLIIAWFAILTGCKVCRVKQDRVTTPPIMWCKKCSQNLNLTKSANGAIIRTYQTEQRQIANVWFGAIRKRVARVLYKSGAICKYKHHNNTLLSHVCKVHTNKTALPYVKWHEITCKNLSASNCAKMRRSPAWYLENKIVTLYFDTCKVP